MKCFQYLMESINFFKSSAFLVIIKLLLIELIFFIIEFTIVRMTGMNIWFFIPILILSFSSFIDISIRINSAVRLSHILKLFIALFLIINLIIYYKINYLQYKFIHCIAPVCCSMNVNDLIRFKNNVISNIVVKDDHIVKALKTLEIVKLYKCNLITFSDFNTTIQANNNFYKRKQLSFLISFLKLDLCENEEELKNLYLQLFNIFVDQELLFNMIINHPILFQKNEIIKIVKSINNSNIAYNLSCALYEIFSPSEFHDMAKSININKLILEMTVIRFKIKNNICHIKEDSDFNEINFLFNKSPNNSNVNTAKDIKLKLDYFDFFVNNKLQEQNSNFFTKCKSCEKIYMYQPLLCTKCFMPFNTT